MEYFGFKLKALRTAKGLTQKQLSDYLELDKATISCYENNSAYPSINILIKICNYFNVSSDYLLGIDTNFNNMKNLTDKQYKIINELINQFITLNELIPLDKTDE